MFICLLLLIFTQQQNEFCNDPPFYKNRENLTIYIDSNGNENPIYTVEGWLIRKNTFNKTLLS